MVLSSSVSLGIRYGTLRTCSRIAGSAPLQIGRSNTRLFSSLLQPSSRRILVLQGPTASRNFSIWPLRAIPTAETQASLPPAPTEASNIDDVVPTPSFASTVPSESISAADASVMSDPAASLDPSSAVESLGSTITDTLIQNAPTALQYGDFAAMGLAGWSPAGIIRWSFEIINVTTGMPWFWTIVAGSAFWRLACVPFALKGLQASARMQPLQPQIMKLQQDVKRASESRDRLELQKASLAMSTFYKENGINPFAGLISLIQMPITLGIFFGVQKMCKLPVEQLTQSGIALLPDLTVVDPTLVLPIALCAAVNMQISLGARDVNTIERPGMGHFMNVMRVLTIPGVWFMSSFPVGLLVSLLTTASLTVAQTLALRSPAVRRALTIPIPPPETRGKLPSMSSTLVFTKKFLWDDVIEAAEKKKKEEGERQRTRMKKRF